MDNLGDHVLGAGVIRALRERHPDAQLSAFIPSALTDLYAHCPHLAATVPLPPASAYLRDRAAFTALLQGLQVQPKFDWVINPRFAEDWYAAGLICKVLSSPGGRVAGFRQSYSPIGGFDPNPCYTELLDAPADLHSARYAELFVSALTGGTAPAPPEVWFGEADWLQVAQSFGLESRGYVVVGLGASFPYKRPSLETYQHLVRRLVAQSLRVILAGTGADRPFAELLMAAYQGDVRLRSACGQLRLYDLSALLAHARLYVGPDAGPKHMAAARGTPVLEIGWVPANYPVSSRGPGTAGVCWSAWQTLRRTVCPQPAVFAQTASRPEFYTQPIAGIDPGEVEQSLAELIALTVPAARI